MATHGCSLSKPATCLAGLRRLGMASASGPGSTITTAGRAPAAASATAQTRAKSMHLRPQDRGVLIRLLEDVPKFGRKGAIFRTERGRMRNEWFPTNKAEYLTRMRLRELLIGPDDIGERDRAFFPLPREIEVVPTPTPKPLARPQTLPKAVLEPLLEPISKPVVEPKTPAIKLEPLTYAQIHSLLSKNVPGIIQIQRRLEQPLLSYRRISPLIAQPRRPDENTPDLPLQGSVSADAVVAHIKGHLREHLNERLLSLEPEQIRFVELPGGSDKIITTGTFRVEIRVAQLKPIVKSVKVVPDKESLEEE